MPSNNSNKPGLRQSLDRATAMHRAGRTRHAITLLEPFTHSHPRSTALAGYLGGLYLELEEPALAADMFKRATKLSPHSEMASVGLFHSLWDLGSCDQALREMRRFLKLADSHEYARLLRDLAVEGRLVPHMAGAA